eukprot:1158456-Pelagomonas_calceolata.AAC.6
MLGVHFGAYCQVPMGSLTSVRGSLGGRLVDTPGFSQPSLEAVSASELAAYFPEMQALLDAEGPCRFRYHMACPKKFKEFVWQGL